MDEINILYQHSDQTQLNDLWNLHVGDPSFLPMQVNIIGVSFDIDNKKIYTYSNGVVTTSAFVEDYPRSSNLNTQIQIGKLISDGTGSTSFVGPVYCSDDVLTKPAEFNLMLYGYHKSDFNRIIDLVYSDFP